MSNLIELERHIQQVEPDFTSALIDNSLNFAREAGFAMQALQSNNALATAAARNTTSLRNAVVNVAAIGISLNPAEKQAYLVPRDGRVCLDISYMGLIDLATRSGSIMWAKAELVYEQDTFVLHGVDQQPTHSRNPFATDRGPVIGAYCVAKLPNGDYLTEIMSKPELDNIKNRSAAGKKGSGPWATDEGEMQRKTVIKRASKYWPKSERLSKAIDMLNVENDEGIETEIHLSPARLNELIALLSTAENKEQLTDIWRAGAREIKERGTEADYRKYQEHAANAGKELEKRDVVDVEMREVNDENAHA